MPVHKVIKNGLTLYQWGNHGKLYRNKSDAEAQGRAIYSSGYSGKGGKRERQTPPENKYYLTRTKYPLNQPQPTKLISYPELRQTFNYDCGATSFQQLLVYYGYEIREDDLIKLLGTESPNIEEHGTDISAIVKIAKKFGLTAVVKTEMTIEDLHSLINKDIPIILLGQAWRDSDKRNWKTDFKDGHYFTAIGYNDGFMFFEDPSSFVRTYLSNQELLDRWHDMSEDRGSCRRGSWRK